jgi:START-like superfamily domain
MAKKQQYQLEYLVHSSIKVLYNSLSTLSGLSEWFAHNVNIKNNVYTFVWEGSEQEAIMLTSRKDDHVRFQWLEDSGTDCYFELKIKVDALTNEVALIVTDFAEADDLRESKMLWDSQISDLKHILGSA